MEKIFKVGETFIDKVSGDRIIVEHDLEDDVCEECYYNPDKSDLMGCVNAKNRCVTKNYHFKKIEK